MLGMSRRQGGRRSIAQHLDDAGVLAASGRSGRGAAAAAALFALLGALLTAGGVAWANPAKPHEPPRPADCGAYRADYAPKLHAPIMALLIDGLTPSQEMRDQEMRDQAMRAPATANEEPPDEAPEKTAEPAPEAEPTLLEAFLALPAPLAFTVDPRDAGAEVLIAKIRDAGHEAVLRLPIAPYPGPPEPDQGAAGPLPTLHSGILPDENLARMQRSLDAVTGYVGVYAGPGAPITANAALMKPLLLALKSEGCLLIDGRGSSKSIAGLLARRLKAPSAPVIDRIAPDSSRRDAFHKLERIANGVGEDQGVVLLAFAEPETLRGLTAWLDKRISTQTHIAPLSLAGLKAQPQRW